MTSLISVGRAQLKVIGLNPQRVSRSSESRVPGKPTFNGMDYQRTGMGERTTLIEAITFPLVTGGMDALGHIDSHHHKQDVVSFFRLGANYLGIRVGAVVVRSLYIDEDRFHPFTGVGRSVLVEAELLHVSDF